MKRILWISRHNILPKQVEELRRLFGEFELIVDHDVFKDVNDIVSRIHAANADEVVIVAPLSLLQLLIERGIKPLWAEMIAVDPLTTSFDERSDFYQSPTTIKRFVGFKRLVGITLEFEPVQPAGSP